MSSWNVLRLFFLATERCKICAKVAPIYQWPRVAKLNDSATGCLKCLHEWLEYRNPASEAKPIELHNGKPVLELSANLGPRRRGGQECSHCGKTFYGVERLTAHRRNTGLT